MSLGDLDKTLSKGLIGVAELKLTNDVQGELALSNAEMSTIELIARSAGEVDFYPDKVKQATNGMIQKMQAEGYLTVTGVQDAITGRITHLKLRLTDKARNVIAIDARRKIVAGDVAIV